VIDRKTIGTHVHLNITMEYNQLCPDCCNGMSLSGRVRGRMSPGLVGEVGRMLGPLGTRTITGGEPTMHPAFHEVVMAVVENYKYNKLSLATNGFGLAKKKNHDVLYNLDNIRITNYTHGTFSRSSNPNCNIDNTECVDGIKESCPEGVSLSVRVGGHRKNNPEFKYPCIKALTTVAIFKDRVYPCCAAAGLPSSGSVKISENWKDDVSKVSLPCPECPFAYQKLYSPEYDVDIETMVLK